MMKDKEMLDILVMEREKNRCGNCKYLANHKGEHFQLYFYCGNNVYWRGAGNINLEHGLCDKYERFKCGKTVRVIYDRDMKLTTKSFIK